MPLTSAPLDPMDELKKRNQGSLNDTDWCLVSSPRSIAASPAHITDVDEQIRQGSHHWIINMREIVHLMKREEKKRRRHWRRVGVGDELVVGCDQGTVIQSS